MSRRRASSERPPIAIIALASVAALFFALPFAGLLWRLPWGDVWEILGEEEVRTALWLSIRTSLAALRDPDHMGPDHLASVG